MRTSLNNLKLAEEYIEGKLDAGEAAVFEARLILDAELRNDIEYLQRSYKVIRYCGRKLLKNRIEEIHHKLFQHSQYSDFRNNIMKLFGR